MLLYQSEVLKSIIFWVLIPCSLVEVIYQTARIQISEGYKYSFLATAVRTSGLNRENCLEAGRAVRPLEQ
jgi:hypothetical protein